MQGDPSSRCRNAHALRVSGHWLEAETEYRAVLALLPGYEAAAVSLAFLLREQGRNQAAAETIVGHWRHAPRSRSGDLKAINFLIETGCHALASGLADAAVQREPDDAAVQEGAGIIAQANGDFDIAAARFRAALDIDARRAASWLRLVHTRRFTQADDPDFRLLLDTVARPQLPTQLGACLGFALGKVYDDLGEYARASAALRSANALASQAAGGDPDPAIAGDPSASWPRLVPQQDDDRAPLFVVGMPRSGTTLLTRQLAGHPAIRDRGELNWLPTLVARLGTRPSPEAMRQARSLYLAQLYQDDAHATWYVDKNPLNYRYLGAISRLFPEARVLHSRRGARDVALSLWSQHFAHPGMAWSYQFDRIAAEFERHQAATAVAAAVIDAGHWRAIGYERLVREPDVVAGELRAWLGLSTSARTQAAAGAIVTTASVWQARQPVYATSVARWRHYQPYVPELLQFEQ